MSKNLAKYIMDEADFLNLTDFYDEEAKSVVEYFLQKNIECLFGKNEFTINEDEKSEMLIDKVIGEKGKNKLNIDFCGMTFEINYESNEKIGSLWITDMSKIHSSADLTYDKILKKYTNCISYFRDDIHIREHQSATVSKHKVFDYQKEISRKNGETEKYPRYMMVPAGIKSNPDNEMFKIISSETTNDKNDSFLKKIIDEVKKPSLVPVKTAYGDYNVLNYVSEIFNIMEEKTKEYEESKRL